MVDNVNNLSVDIAKYGKLTTNQSKIETMQDIRRDCNYILAGLATLPINQENVINSTRFFNQVDGVWEAYSRALSSGKNLSAEQERVFDEIGLVVGKIKANFNAQNYGMYDTNFSFVDATIFDNTGMNELSTSLGDLTSDSIDYPSMIFDGPFSSALETTIVKGLGDREYSQEEAYYYLKNVVYNNRETSIKYIKTTNGDIVTYDYLIEIDGKRFGAQVSKMGRLLITLSGYAEGGDPIMKVEQAEEMAVTFANNIGFENMQSVWHEVNANVAYINLAPVVDGVIWYPDLVKIKVDLTAQDIIGFEAVNYALNHVDRSVEFTFPTGDAESLLGFDYEVLNFSRAIIRLDSGKEIASYEYILDRIDGMYYYYIDANTGEIAKIMKLVQIKDVEKLI